MSEADRSNFEMKNVTCILHHHIGEESEYEAGLNVTTSVSAYEAQIDWLSRHYNFVSLEDLLTGDLPKKPLLLTFDDAFHSVLENVRTVLAPKGIPSVFFINPALIGDDAVSLDSMLAWATYQAGFAEVCKTLNIPLRSGLGDIISKDMSKLGSAQRQRVIQKLIEQMGQPDLSTRASLISADGVRELQSLGVEIGNHTQTHVHCRSLSEEEMEDEIVNSKKALEGVSGQKVRSLSIPYGHENDLTDDVLNCARASGHEAIFLVHSRTNLRRPAPDIWYRTSLHNEAPQQLKAEVRTKPMLRTIKSLVLG